MWGRTGGWGGLWRFDSIWCIVTWCDLILLLPPLSDSRLFSLFLFHSRFQLVHRTMNTALWASWVNYRRDSRAWPLLSWRHWKENLVWRHSCHSSVGTSRRYWATRTKHNTCSWIWALQTWRRAWLRCVPISSFFFVESTLSWNHPRLLYGPQRGGSLCDVTWQISMTSQHGGSLYDVTAWQISLWRHSMADLSMTSQHGRSLCDVVCLFVCLFVWILPQVSDAILNAFCRTCAAVGCKTIDVSTGQQDR